MWNNDLANTPAPTIYVVWEGLIATCGREKKFARCMKTKRYEKALSLFETHQRTVDAMWQTMMRGTLGVSVVTFLPSSIGRLLPERLDDDMVPYRDFLVLTPEILLKRLPHMPWAYVVADPDPRRVLAYGSKGRHVPAEAAELIGFLQ